MTFAPSSRQSAFTLLELSIVLVIIGLLVGGIFAGSTLIRSMELKSIQTEANDYRTAISAFRDRFQALPGDMPNATEIWGEVSGGGQSCPNGAGSGTQTCNGNNNQQIAPTANNMGESGEEYESFRAWQQLQNAGLSQTPLSGATGGGSDRNSLVGKNIPRSKFDKSAGWSLFYIPYVTQMPTPSAPCASESDSSWGSFIRCRLTGGSEFNWFVMGQEYGNTLTLGAQHNSQYAVNPVINPSDAQNLDDKFDDGIPITGSMRAIGDMVGHGDTTTATPDCMKLDDPQNVGYNTNIYYNISEREKACAFAITVH